MTKGSPISKAVRPSPQVFHHSSFHHSHSPTSPSPVSHRSSIHHHPNQGLQAQNSSSKDLGLDSKSKNQKINSLNNNNINGNGKEDIFLKKKRNGQTNRNPFGNADVSGLGSGNAVDGGTNGSGRAGSGNGLGMSRGGKGKKGLERIDRPRKIKKNKNDVKVELELMETDPDWSESDVNGENLRRKSKGEGDEDEEDVKGYYESSEGEDLQDETAEVVLITELPPHPGKAPEDGGVVTWSDYELEDFVEGGRAIQVPSSAQELNGLDEEMWFERLDSEGQSETETEDGLHPYLVVDSWGGRMSSEEEDGRVNSEMMSEDDGETTDSLDEDDHVALVRFGIEVEEQDHSNEPILPMTTSLAELELSTATHYPSLADDVSQQQQILPAELSATISMEALANDPERVLKEAAKSLGVDIETAASILTGVGMTVVFNHQQEHITGGRTTGHGISRKHRHKKRKLDLLKKAAMRGKEGRKDDSENEKKREQEENKEPVMGTFLVHSDSGKSVIDGKRPPASPFSRKPGSVRPSRANSTDRQRTPMGSRRRMSDTSTTSAGVNHPLSHLDSPFTFQPMALDDVLDDSAPFSDAQESAETLQALSRWDRVPIGAFRNQTTRNMGLPLSMGLFNSPVLSTGSPVVSRKGARENMNLLPPPDLLSSMPMFGLSQGQEDGMSVVGGVKSRKERRKEKKSKSTISRSQSLKEPYRVKEKEKEREREKRDRSHSLISSNGGINGTGPMELSEKNLKMYLSKKENEEENALPPPLPLPSAHLTMDDPLFKSVELSLNLRGEDEEGMDITMNDLA